VQKNTLDFVLIGINGPTPACYAFRVNRPIRNRTICKKNKRYEYVAQKLSSLSETEGKENPHRDSLLLMRQVQLEGLAGLPCWKHQLASNSACSPS